MRKTLGVLVACILAIWAISGDQRTRRVQMRYPPEISQAPSLVVLGSFDQDGILNGYGNAFLVDSKHCLYATVAHVVDEGVSFALISSRGQRTNVFFKNEWVNFFADLAVVQAKNLKFCQGVVALPLASSPPKSDDWAVSIGYCPLGSFSIGDAHAIGCIKPFVIRKPETDLCVNESSCIFRDILYSGVSFREWDWILLYPKQIYATHAASPLEPGLVQGMSGSALINKEGTVVGLAHVALAAPGKDALFAPAYVLQELLDQVRRDLVS